MSDAETSPRRLIPYADPEMPGDLVPPLDLWIEGEIDYGQLSPGDQRSARLMFADRSDGAQKLHGNEQSVRFLPDDRFTGVGQDWLIERLVLSPAFGPVSYAPNGAPELVCFLDALRLDVVGASKGFPLGPSSEKRTRTAATIVGGDGQSSNQSEWTLLECSPWLIELRGGSPVAFLPVPTNEMGEESEYRVAYEVGVWVAEAVAKWSASGEQWDLTITAGILDNDDDSEGVIESISHLAQGGRGIVQINGRVIYDHWGTS